MCGRYLPVLILKHITPSPLQHPRFASAETCGVLAKRVASTTGFDPDHSHALIGYEIAKQANRVAAAADTGDQQIGNASFNLENLLSSLAAEHSLKIAHHCRVRVWAHHRTQQIICVRYVGDPITERFVYRI